MKKENGYVGKVKNTGAQYVKAPISSSKKSSGVVKKGTDLRAGKK